MAQFNLTPEMIEQITDIVHDMPLPTEYDQESVAVFLKTPTVVSVQIVVDKDGGVDIDALGALHRSNADTLHSKLEKILGSDVDYEIEFMSRGASAPLTKRRHWRRNYGRKVTVKLADNSSVTGRIGNISADDVYVALIVNDKGKISTLRQPLAEIKSAKIVIEFKPPSPTELAMCEES